MWRDIGFPKPLAFCNERQNLGERAGCVLMFPRQLWGEALGFKKGGRGSCLEPAAGRVEAR